MEENIQVNPRESLKSFLRKKTGVILTFISLILICIQFSYFTYAVSKHVDNWAIIYSFDNDAANGIRVAQRSGWLNNNQYYNYGNLYFRVARTIERFNPFTTSEQNYFSAVSEESFHFTLMMISLFCLFGLSFLLSSILSRNYPYRLLCMFIINIAFMKTDIWVEYVLKVHPDFLLCLMAGISVFLSKKYLEEKKEYYFYLTAVSWGLTLGIKLFTVFYLPALALMFFPGFKKENLVKAIKFYCIIGATYLIIGFPQSFEFVQTIKFLIYQSSFSVSPTRESFIEWWQLLGNQIYLPLLAIIVLALLFRNNTDETIFLKKGNLIRLFIISFFPFVMLLERKVTSPYHHYTLPVVTTLLIFFAFFITKVFSEIPQKSKKNSESVIAMIALLTGIFFMTGTSLAIPGELNKLLNCREEARNIYKMTTHFQQKKLIVQADPYVPFSPELGFVQSSWFRTFNDLRPGNAHVLVLNRNFYKRYITGTEPSHYVQQDVSDWKPIRKFYLSFYNQKEVTDIYNQKWVKIESDNCGWEIWILKNLAN